MTRLVGAVEAGGTKFRAAVVDSDLAVVDSVLAALVAQSLLDD